MKKREPDSIVLDMPFKAAIKKAVSKPRPPGGWPARETAKRAKTKKRRAARQKHS